MNPIFNDNNKLIVFDLGNVLYPIDIQKSVNAFRDLGLVHFEELYSLKKQDNLFNLLEVGSISTNDFCEVIRQRSGMEGLSNIQINEAWNALLLGFDPSTFTLLSQLKENGFKVALLSNTNDIHFAQIDAECMSLTNQSFKSWFDYPFLSFELGCRKPDAPIFELVESHTNFKGQDIIFLDDNLKNLEMSQKFSWTAIECNQNLSNFL